MDWKEAAVPPVLSAANEKGLNADRYALAGHGKDVCISQALRVDRLTALNESQRFQAVAVNRGQLEIHRVRCALHCCAQLALHLRRFAREKILRVPRQFRIIRFTDPSDTGGRARSDEHTSELQSLMRISY